MPIYNLPQKFLQKVDFKEKCISPYPSSAFALVETLRLVKAFVVECLNLN